jgi:hypothetical protein
MSMTYARYRDTRNCNLIACISFHCNSFRGLINYREEKLFHDFSKQKRFLIFDLQFANLRSYQFPRLIEFFSPKPCRFAISRQIASVLACCDKYAFIMPQVILSRKSLISRFLLSRTEHNAI